MTQQRAVVLDQTFTPEQEAERARNLGRIWAEPQGLLGWFKAVHHTTIGKRYMVTAFGFFLAAGLLAREEANVQAAAVSPWLLLPAVPVTVAILAFNFLGDGLRDALDPRSSGGRR